MANFRVRNRGIAIFTAVVLAITTIPDPFSIFAGSSDMEADTLSAEEQVAAGGTYDETYDELVVDHKFEDTDPVGNTEGAGDKSRYNTLDSQYLCWDGISFNKNYFASLDFKYTDKDQLMQVANKESGGNVGPLFTVAENRDGTYTFRTNTGSKSYQNLYDKFELNQWYSLELEGRMTVTDAVTVFRLYKYDVDGNKELVNTIENLNLRNFAAGGSSSGKYLRISSGVCIDNEYAFQENADAVQITEQEDRSQVQGGKSLYFTAEALRNETADGLTQPSIKWSLSGIKEGEEAYFTMDQGHLSVDANADDQDIKVVATAVGKGNPYAEYEVHVIKTDTSAEIFDAAVVSGEDEVRVGDSSAYTFQATKNGSDVTENLTKSDYIWNIYDATGARPLGNQYITITDGVLTVGQQVLGQTIRVRVSTTDGIVYGDQKVTIENPAKESVIACNACEDKTDNDAALVKQGSWDGSSYYQSVESDFFGKGTIGETTLSSDTTVDVMLDIKFTEANCGFTTMNRTNGGSLFLVSHNGKLACQTGSSSYSDLTDVDGNDYVLDSDSWYHIELMLNDPEVSLKIGKYSTDGTLTEEQIFTRETGMAFRASKGFNRITINKDTCIDNYYVVYPEPTQLEVAAVDGQNTVAAGTSMEFSVEGRRNGLLIPNMDSSKITWAVYDSDNQFPVDDDTISIIAGKLSSYGLTKPQTVNIRATVAKDKSVYASIPIAIEKGNIMTVTNIGVDQTNDRHIEKLYVEKNAAYDDEIAFLIALYDKDGRMTDSYVKKVYGKNFKTGANEVSVDYTLPDTFDKATGKAVVYAWTGLGTTEEPQDISGGFHATFKNGEVTVDKMPEFTADTTIAIYAPDVKDSDLSGNLQRKLIYAGQTENGDFGAIPVPELAAGTYKVAVGVTVNGELRVYTTSFTVTGAGEKPTEEPTEEPTVVPTQPETSTEVPTDVPTEAPTPTQESTETPTEVPTQPEASTEAPTNVVTEAPTQAQESTETPTEATTRSEASTQTSTQESTPALQQETTTEAVGMPTQGHTQMSAASTAGTSGQKEIGGTAQKNTDAESGEQAESTTKTGDTNHVVLYLSLIILIAGGLTVAEVYRRKKSNHIK